MAAAALAIYLLGLVLAFGWRSVEQWRRTGDTGLRLDAGPPGSVAWWAKLAFITALLFGLAGPVGGLAGLDPIPFLDHTWLQAVGVVLAISGVFATLVAQLGMGTSWRVGVDPDEHTTLVTTGIFTVVRNPIFTAMIATSIGLACMVSNPIAVAATALLVISIQVQVRAVEEPYLTRTHGTVYTTYTAHVGRFLPGMGLISSPRPARTPPAGT